MREAVSLNMRVRLVRSTQPEGILIIGLSMLAPARVHILVCDRRVSQ